MLIDGEVGMKQLKNWLDIFCTGHRFALSAASWQYLFPKNMSTANEMLGDGSMGEGSDSEDASEGGGESHEKYHVENIPIADKHVFTTPHISAVVKGTPFSSYKIEKRVAIKDAYAEEKSELPEGTQPNTIVVPGDETTYSNATFFAEKNDLFKAVLTETGWAKKTTNVFIYSTSLGKDSGELGGPKKTGAAYQEGEKQDSIWITTGQTPSTDRIKRGVRLNQAGRALDYFEKLIGDGDIVAGHAVPRDADISKINPQVAIQYGGDLDIKGNSEYQSEGTSSGKDGSEIGTVLDDTGTTYDANTGKYKIGPFFMSDYVYVYNQSAIFYSGADQETYRGMIGGIVHGEIKLDKGDPIEIGNGEGKAQIVYTDMNGKATHKGKYEEKYEDTLEDIYEANKAAVKPYLPFSNLSEPPGGPNDKDGIDGTWENYEFPWPSSTFYIEVDKETCGDAITLQNIIFEYRRTKGEGEGWSITSRYVKVVWDLWAIKKQTQYRCLETSLEPPNPDRCAGGTKWTHPTKSEPCLQTCQPTCGCPRSHGSPCWGCPGHYCGGCESDEDGDSYCPGHPCPDNGYCTHYCSPPSHKGIFVCTQNHSNTCDPHGNCSEEGCNKHFCWEVRWRPQGTSEDQDSKQEHIMPQQELALVKSQVEVYGIDRENELNVRLTTYVSIDKHITEVKHEGDGKVIFPDGHPDCPVGDDNELKDEEARKLQTDFNKLKNAVKVEKGDIVTYDIDILNKQEKKVQVRVKDILPKKIKAGSIKITGAATNGSCTTQNNEWFMTNWIELEEGTKDSPSIKTITVELIGIREEGVVELGSSEIYNSKDPILEDAKKLILEGASAPIYNGWVETEREAPLIDTGYNENRSYIVTRNKVMGPTKESDSSKDSINVNYTRVAIDENDIEKNKWGLLKESKTGPVVNLAEFDTPKNHVQEYETTNPDLAQKSEHKTVIESSDFYTIKEYDINIDKYIRNVEHDWSNNEYNKDNPHELIMSEDRDTSANNMDYADSENNIDSTIYPNIDGGGPERQGNNIGGTAEEQEQAKEKTPVWVEKGDIITYCITIYNTIDHDNDDDNELGTIGTNKNSTPPYAKYKDDDNRKRKTEDGDKPHGPFYSPDKVYVDVTDTLPKKILDMEDVTTMLQGDMDLGIESVEAYKNYDFAAKTGEIAEYDEKDVGNEEFSFKTLEVPANGTTTIVVTIVVEEVEKATVEENNIKLDREDGMTDEGWGYHVRNINYKDSNKYKYDDYKIKNNTSKDDTSDWYKLSDYQLTIDKYVSSYNHLMMDWNNGTNADGEQRNSEGSGIQGKEADNFFAYERDNDYKEEEIVDNKGFSDYDNFKTGKEVSDQTDREYIYETDADRESREGKEEDSKDWMEGSTTGIQNWRKENALPVEKREKIVYSIRLTNEAEEDIGFEGLADRGPFDITGRKAATQVRPTKIVEQLEDGLTLIEIGSEQAGTGTGPKCSTHMVDAVIYNKDGSVDEGKTDKIENITVKDIGGGKFEFELGNEVILDPGQYLVYYVMVEVERSNMYLLTLENIATITQVTNINHGEAGRGDRIVVEKDINDLDAEGNDQNIVPDEEKQSKEYVKLKEIVVAGKAWLDENRDGIKDEEEYVFENINVVLLDGNGTEITRVKTDESGFYTFGRLYKASGEGKSQTQTEIGGTAIQKQYDENYDENSEYYEYVVEFEYDGLMYKTTEIYGGNKESVGRFDLGGIATNNYGKDQLEILAEEWLQLDERKHYNENTKTAWESDQPYSTDFAEYAYDSNAYEYHDIRKEFNEKYETISYNQAQTLEGTNPITLEYSKDGHVSKLVEADRDTLDGGNRLMKAESFIQKGSDHPGTFSGSDTIDTLWIYEAPEVKLAETEYLKYVNLGLVEREEFDLSLTKDLFEIKTTINGEEVTYQYDKLKERYSGDEQGVYDKRQNDIGEGVLTDPLDGRELNKDYKLIEGILGKIGNPDADSEYDIVNPYKLKLYESDYKYRKDLYENKDVQDYKGINSELNIEVTYKIAIDSLVIDNDEPEQESDNDVKIEAKINEIVDHYDANFIKFGTAPGNAFIKSGSEENTILLKLFDDLGYLKEDLEKSNVRIAEAWLGDRNGERFEDNNELVVETATDYNNDPLNNSSYHTAYIKGSDREEGIVRLDEGGRTYLGDPIKDKSARRNLAQDVTKVGEYIDENDNYLGETDGIFNTDERVDRDVAYVYIKYIVDKTATGTSYDIGYIGEKPSEGRMLKIKPQDGNEDSMEGISSISEIGAYSTYYEENNDGNIEIAGVVDRDSNPGNVPEHIDNYEETAEDDTCRTKVNITVSMEEAPVPDDPTGGEPPTGGSEDFLIRVLTGTVWDDTRSEKAGTGGETQYVGNGINTVDSGLDERDPLRNAKANANVNYLNGKEFDIEKDSEDDYLENKDVPIKNMKAEIIEIVEIPGEIFGEEGSRYYEQILDPDKVTWKANRKQFTRTDEKGNYALSGFIPGYYVVRFTYGDAYADGDDSHSVTAKDNGSQIALTFDGKIISEEMSVFNGQDYKSTKYATGLTEGTTARMGDGTEANIPSEFPYGMDEEHKITGSYLGENSSYDLRFAHYDKVIQAIENKAENDARDDESARLKSISYSETMTNKLAEVLKASYAKYAKDGLAGETQKQYYNSDDLKASKLYDIDETNERYSDKKVNDYLEKLLTNTAMNADTIIFHIKPEKGDSIPEREGIYADYTGDTDTKYVFDRLFNKQYMNAETTDVKANALPDNITYDNFEHMLLEDLEKRHYKVENIDFGIEYRPESQVSLHKEIKSIEVTPSGSEVPLVKIAMKNIISDSGIIHEVDMANSIGLENVQFLPNAYKLNIGGYNIEDFKVWNEDEQGFVYINIDAEILQGCAIRIDYGLTATNEGEVDRINRNLDDIRYAENDATPKAEGDRKYTTEGKIYNSVTGKVGAIYTPAATARNQLDKEFYVREKEYEEGEDITKIIYRKKLKLYDREDVKKRILKSEKPEEFYGRYMGNTYYTGDVEEPDTIVRVKFDKILDYVDNNLVFEEVKQFGKDPADIIDRGWKTSSSGELANYSLLKDTVFNMTLTIGGKLGIPGLGNPITTGYISDKKGELYDTKQRSNLIISNDDSTKDYKGGPQPTGETNSERNKSLSRFLLPKVTATSQALTVTGESGTIINGTTYSGRINIVPTKFFAQESDTQDMQFENVAEVIQFTVTNGRRTNFRTTIGNAEVGHENRGEFPPAIYEPDTSTVEQITLTPPTGFDMTRLKRAVSKVVEEIKQVVTDNKAVVAVIIVIAVIGIVVVIGKYIFEKIKNRPIK